MFKTAIYTLNFFIFSCLNLQAMADFKVGDVLLLDLDCYSCQRIEDETFGPFSHSGVIVEVNQKLVVAQSLSKVHHVEIKAFLKFSNKPVLHIRPKNISDLQRVLISQKYSSKFYGLQFDHDYLWDDETLYCSEFLYKLLSSALKFDDLIPAPMNFSRNYDFWKMYFGKNPPQGQIGLSPNDFYRSSDFDHLEYIDQK